MELSTLYRECTLNQVSENDIGKERRVAGWVENIRDHGGVSFIDLRDMYGVLQIVMRDTSLLKGINKEDCISVLGEIEKRDEETYNPKIPTGTIDAPCSGSPRYLLPCQSRSLSLKNALTALSASAMVYSLLHRTTPRKSC